MFNLQKSEILRHSCAHILAAAVLKMFPEAKFGIGPTIEDGFYYDFDLPRTLIPEDLPILEEKMREIIKNNYPFEKKEIEADKAIELFEKLKQQYKVELIKDLQADSGSPASQQEVGLPLKISIYKTNDFVDLCRGPHIDSTNEIKSDAFKLLKIAGAYWRGSEKNPMLQRIYGTAFESKKELDAYLNKIIEAEKRDHRKLGQDLDLFHIDEEFGAGLPLWHPKGAIMCQIIEDFVLKEYLKRGYQLVKTPHIANIQLFKTSGHWDFYHENMYAPIQIDEEQYILKPMNCPGHLKIYKSKIHSYKELPIRYTELGTVYRYERSGTLHGLIRVRGFTQDDAHIICAPAQLHKELVEAIKLTKFILKTFGFKDLKIALSVRDPKNKEKYLGSDKIWDLAENALAKAIESQKWKYERAEGEAVFYGPKMDILVRDAIGRNWQITTLQIDFNLPERFDISYIDEKGKKQRPIMLHRALLGSLERFIGLLIEHYAGAFPLWLAPVQVFVIPVANRHKKYADQIGKILKEKNIRAEVKDAAETVGKKIRDAELQKIPYMLVVGDKEMKIKPARIGYAKGVAGGSVSVRDRKKGDLGKMKTKAFFKKITDEIEKKK